MLQEERYNIFKMIQEEILGTDFKGIEELEDCLDESIFLIKNEEEPKVDLCKISKFYKKYNLAIRECENYWKYASK